MKEFVHTHSKQALALDSWKILRIVSEFVEGFETMLEIGPSVSIFGSARTKPENPYYQLATQVAEAIAKRGFAIITGGGPGIMEAANMGAQKGGGRSCGVGVDLPFESSLNPYIDREYNLNFRYFFVRKVMFIRYAQAFVFLPGGMGTLDELFEALTLMQTGRIHPFPIYLVGKEYWQGVMSWLQDVLLKEGYISKGDIDRLQVTDDPEQIAAGIEEHFRKEHLSRNF